MAQYTVREIADEFGVTKQAVSKYLRSSGLQKEAVKDGNRFLINENLRKRLETHFTGKSETKPTTNENSETKTETDENLVSVLQEAYEDLRKQLEIKDEQIRDLNKALINAQEQGKAAQALHAVDRKEDLALESEGQKKGRWSRLKEAWRG